MEDDDDDDQMDELISDILFPYGDDDDVLAVSAILQAVPSVMPSSATIASAILDVGDNHGDHTGERTRRRLFDHALTAKLIHDHYLGPTPLHGSQFKLQFRVSLTTFQYMLESIMNSNTPFYNPKPTNKRRHATIEAKLLLPLKTLAYGVPMHCFVDYFNMSNTFAAQCCEEFDNVLIKLFSAEFLRSPTAEDLKSIVAFHQEIYGVPGMFGSLDCTHTDWRSCPVAWQSSYKSAHNGSPSLVLEALGDHHLWVWHFAYGFAGSLNDINVLRESPLMERFISGQFERLEKSAKVTPYVIGTEMFDSLYVLVDGIYPAYSRFVRAMKRPVTNEEKFFAKWQEACRKDIERVFGVMKRVWKFLAHPIELQGLDKIASRVYACLILHNMNVAERIMGDVKIRYRPSHDMSRDTTDPPPNPADTAAVLERLRRLPPNIQQRIAESIDIINGTRPAMVDAFSLLAARAERLEKLQSHDECFRLYHALQAFVNTYGLKGAKK